MAQPPTVHLEVLRQLKIILGRNTMVTKDVRVHDVTSKDGPADDRAAKSGPVDGITAAGSRALYIMAALATLIDTTNADGKERDMRNAKIALGVGVGATAVVVGGPAILSAAGFGAVGIVKGSLAASAMSTAATTGVGGAAVGVAQSIGAAGLSAAGTALGAVAGGVAGGAAVSKASQQKENNKRN